MAETWKYDGIRVVSSAEMIQPTSMTDGMDRMEAISQRTVGAKKIWAGNVTIQPNARTGAHHHGHLESVIYIVEGRAQMRWGERLEFVAEAGPGDYLYVPPFVPHQEINASPDTVLECILVRNDGEAVVVNLDLDVVDEPSPVVWTDPAHPA